MSFNRRLGENLPTKDFSDPCFNMCIKKEQQYIPHTLDEICCNCRVQ